MGLFGPSKKEIAIDRLKKSGIYDWVKTLKGELIKAGHDVSETEFEFDRGVANGRLGVMSNGKIVGTILFTTSNFKSASYARQAADTRNYLSFLAADNGIWVYTNPNQSAPDWFELCVACLTYFEKLTS